jgi:undecaprenyl diphosphate synthase
MDGNGRWAKKRCLPRSAGHAYGAENFRSITLYCNKIGIKYLTVYAFSTENWKRPKEEVKILIKLFKKYLEEALRDFLNENIKVNFLGDINIFSEDLKNLINRVKEASKNKTGMTLNIAINYGGRAEILRAVNFILKDFKENKINININEKLFSEKLYTENQPDLDLIIRSSGEFRISNFMLWQAAYAEYFITDVLWPDFKPENLEEILKQFSSRKRRFGGVASDS